jgi:hypothetical protein
MNTLRFTCAGLGFNSQAPYYLQNYVLHSFLMRKVQVLALACVDSHPGPQAGMAGKQAGREPTNSADGSSFS